MRRQIANKRGEKEKGNNSWRWGSTWRVQSRPEWAPASVVLLMSASAHLIIAIPKGEMGYLAVISPKHSPQAQLKSEKHNSPPSLSVFFHYALVFSFFLSSQNSIDSVFLSFLSPNCLWIHVSCPLTANRQWRSRSPAEYCVYFIYLIQYLGHICISLNLVKWVRKRYL